MATNVIFTRGNTATINATAITDGQILFDTQTGAQYLDNNTTRIYIGQTLTVDTTLSKTSYHPIANIGVAGVMVSSLNTIDSVTNEGFITDALVTKQLDMNLKANSNRFIFDYQNGKYGYNTDPNRGAGTFSPFKSAPVFYSSNSNTNSITVVSGKSYLINVAIVSGYEVLEISLSGCTVNYSSPISSSGANNSRIAYLGTKIVDSTSTNIGISFTTIPGAESGISRFVAVNCFEI